MPTHTFPWPCRFAAGKNPTHDYVFDFASHINIFLLRYGEHPDERAVKNEEQTEKLAEVMTLTSIYSGLKEKVRT